MSNIQFGCCTQCHSHFVMELPYRKKRKERLLVRGLHKRKGKTTPTESISLVSVHPLLFKIISARRLRMQEAGEEREMVRKYQ